MPGTFRLVKAVVHGCALQAENDRTQLGLASTSRPAGQTPLLLRKSLIEAAQRSKSRCACVWSYRATKADCASCI